MLHTSMIYEVFMIKINSACSRRRRGKWKEPWKGVPHQMETRATASQGESGDKGINKIENVFIKLKTEIENNQILIDWLNQATYV